VPDPAARWERVSGLVADCLELAPGDRAAFLARECASDAALRAEVEALLAASGEAERFFDTLADEAIPPALAALETSGAGGSRSGREYGAYRVLDELGRGGMGVVYRAEDTRLQRTAALKFLPATALADPQARARLMEEARAASMLDDPNICTIFGIEDTPEGETFIAMAYYEGETLAERIARGPLPVGDALAIAVGITRGLAVAHARGITHRDLTPRNVMLTAHDRVKILDFGLARAAGQAAGSSPAGTPSYMPPEQVMGAATGPESDVWSLGVTLYELLTGRRPFEGNDVAGIIDAVLAASPRPLRELNPRLPEGLERLVLRMLAKAPGDRPADARAVLAALEPMLRRHRSRRARLAVTAIVAVLAALVVALVATRGPAQPPGSVPATRVVLLPFERDSTRRDAVYLAAGLHEVVGNELARIRGIALISWTTQLPGENTPRARRRLGRALGAVAVLEGIVLDGDSVVLRLHDADDDRVLWTGGRDFARRLPGGEGRALALEIAAALGLPTVTSAPALRNPGRFATDPRTGHVYEAVPVTLSWYDAEEAARARTHRGVPGHLATITSQAENDFIARNLPEATAGGYWLGGFRAVRGGTARDGWYWVTGEPFDYARWSGGGPNDYFGEDGLQFWAVPDSAVWNDIDRTSGFEPFVGGFLVEYAPERP
jgi:serine/threonine-protein kinase